MSETTQGLPEQLAEGVWTLEGRFTTMGLPISSRTTLVRLASGGLAVVNPGPLTPGAVEAIERIGVPRVLIAPNRFHHLFAADWKSTWPEALLWAAPGLPEKQPDLPVDAVLGSATADWMGDLEPLPVGGMPKLSEWWFYHAASGTLIVTDILARVGPGQPWFLRLWSALNGSRDRRLAAPRWLRAALVRDKAAVARDVSAALARRPQRLVVAHGDPLSGDVAAEMRRALRWLPLRA